MNTYAIRNFPHAVDIVILENLAITQPVESIVLHPTDNKGIYRFARYLHSSPDPVYIYLDPIDQHEFDLLEAVGVPITDTEEFDMAYTLLRPQVIEQMNGVDAHYLSHHDITTGI